MTLVIRRPVAEIRVKLSDIPGQSRAYIGHGIAVDPLIKRCGYAALAHEEIGGRWYHPCHALRNPTASSPQIIQTERHSDLILYFDGCIVLSETLLALFQREGDRPPRHRAAKPRCCTVRGRERIL